MNKRQTSESGQVLVLLVLGVVVLFGFAALAVDGGMVYSDRRHAQMGSDAASLAGGGATALYMENHGVTYGNFDCTDTAVINAQNSNSSSEPGAKLAAIIRAADNDYTIDTDISDTHGVTTECGIEDHGGWEDKYIDIKTMITKDTETSFAQFVFGGLMRNTVQAVTRVRPRSPAAYGHAIVALNPANCSGKNGASFHGSTEINIHGGGIFSNGCLQTDGGGGPNLDIEVDNGDINYVGEVDDSKNLFDPSPAPSDPLPAESYQVPAPNCSDPKAWNGTASQLKSQFPLSPGLYCVTGQLKFTGNNTFVATEVTFYMVDGDFEVEGTPVLNLTAPKRTPDPAPAIPGMLIYAPQSDVILTGDSGSHFEGTVYAPTGNITLIGNGESDVFQTQLIGWNVEVGGDHLSDVTFSAPQEYSRPALLELYK